MRIEARSTLPTTLRVRGDFQLTIHFTDARSTDDVRRSVTAPARRVSNATTVTADITFELGGFHDKPILPCSRPTFHSR